VKLRALAIAAALLAVAGPANAFFFFFLPLGAIQNAVQGGHCLPASAKDMLAGSFFESAGGCSSKRWAKRHFKTRHFVPRQCAVGRPCGTPHSEPVKFRCQVLPRHGSETKFL
jgi:hypothetical protein